MIYNICVILYIYAHMQMYVYVYVYIHIHRDVFSVAVASEAAVAFEARILTLSTALPQKYAQSIES